MSNEHVGTQDSRDDAAAAPASTPPGHDAQPSGRPGRVLLVGAGPGDPNLLTLAAVHALEQAALVLAADESLVELLDRAPLRLAGSTRVEVLDQGDAEAVVARARPVVAAGHTVVRLVAGDPFLDGPAAQELAACTRAGLRAEMVPGISPMVAVPEYAGVSLHGDDAHLVDLARPGAEQGLAPHLAQAGALVLRLAAGRLPQLATELLATGHAKDEQLLLTRAGGTTHQASRQVRVSELTRAARPLDDDAVVHVLLGPASSATAREGLDWYESLPLFGWRVLVPRTKDQAGPMVERLRTYGAHADEVPTIQVEPPRTPQQMDKAIRGLVEGSYEWVVFTSTNAVRAVREKFAELGLDTRAFSGLRVAAVGEATAAALDRLGIVPDLMPSREHSAAGLAAEFPAYDDLLDPINRVFLPRADIATEVLVAGLLDLGWEVDDVVAYRTVRAAPPAPETREAIKTGKFDAVLFTSSSTVRNMVGIAGKPHNHTVVAAIGPQTAATCVEHGLEVAVQAAQPGALELVDALADFARSRRQELLDEGRPVTRPSETRRRRRSTTPAEASSGDGPVQPTPGGGGAA